MRLRVTLLGVGTSVGVPMVGCRCAVCTSDHPKNQRLRCAAALHLEDGRTFLIDTPADLRQQALRYGVERVDGVLYTHAHADHIYGLDDVRPFNFKQGGDIPCFGSAPTLASIRRAFLYIWEGLDEGGGKPRITLEAVDGPFELPGGGPAVTPVPVLHGSQTVYGYRLGTFAYVTDVSEIPEDSLALLEGLDVLVLDALRYRPHPTHFSVDEALSVTRRLAPARTVFTHMSHEVDLLAPQVDLPPEVEFGHDGLTVELEI